MSVPRKRGLPRPLVRSRIVALLQKSGPGLLKGELVTKIGNTSPQTVQRALKDLREAETITRDTRTGQWSLIDQAFGEPLVNPDPEDLHAVLMAEALVAPVADVPLRDRLRRLAEGLDDKLRERVGARSSHPTLARDAVAATVTTSTQVDAQVLKRLLQAVRREVVQLSYYSPWADVERIRVIEPWQVRLHDGAYYLRCWDRRARGARTLRVVHIQRVSRVPAAGAPRTPIPRRDELWGGGDPALGIDEDRPDTAVIVVRGGVARWLAAIQWAPGQQDDWLVPGELLRRTVSYRSCREMARRVLSVADGVEGIEPPELRDAVVGAMSRCSGFVGGADDLRKIIREG